MSEDNKCIPGQGCSPVIQMSKDFETFIATATQSMREHAKQSNGFWKEQQKSVEKITKQLQEAALKFNDGGHRMEKNEGDIDALGEKQRDHEEGEYGAHSLIKKTLWFHQWGIIVSLGFLVVIAVFIALAHPAFIDVVAKMIGMA